MYKVCVVSHEQQYGKRLQDYWMAHGLDQIQIETASDWDTIQQEENIDMFLCEEEQSREHWKTKRVVTLVSDFNKEQGESKIAKYQRPQDIYERVISLCEHGINEISQEISMERITDGKEQILVYNIQADKVDSYAIGILENCPMDGLIPLHKRNHEEGKMKYYIHGKITLREFIKNRSTDRQLLQILKDIFDVLIRAEDYMLDRNQLLLNLDYVFLHQITGKPSLIYIPEVGKNQGGWIKHYQELMTQLSEIMKKQDSSVDQYLVSLSGNTSEPLQLKEPLHYEQRTEFFPNMQKSNLEHTTTFSNQKPWLFWKKNEKHIVIDRKIFKIGKEKKFVDLWISDNPAVSRNHADLIFQGNVMYLVDKESLNATYVNGRKIPSNVKVQIKDQDCIRLANEEFVYHES